MLTEGDPLNNKIEEEEEEEEEDVIIKQAVLPKQKGKLFGKSGGKRYLVLGKQFLAYYKNQEASEPQGVLPIGQIQRIDLEKEKIRVTGHKLEAIGGLEALGLGNIDPLILNQVQSVTHSKSVSFDCVDSLQSKEWFNALSNLIAEQNEPKEAQIDFSEIEGELDEVFKSVDLEMEQELSGTLDALSVTRMFSKPRSKTITSLEDLKKLSFRQFFVWYYQKCSGLGEDKIILIAQKLDSDGAFIKLFAYCLLGKPSQNVSSGLSSIRSAIYDFFLETKIDLYPLWANLLRSEDDKLPAQSLVLCWEANKLKISKHHICKEKSTCSTCNLMIQRFHAFLVDHIVNLDTFSFRKSFSVEAILNIKDCLISILLNGSWNSNFVSFESGCSVQNPLLWKSLLAFASCCHMPALREEMLEFFVDINMYLINRKSECAYFINQDGWISWFAQLTMRPFSKSITPFIFRSIGRLIFYQLKNGSQNWNDSLQFISNYCGRKSKMLCRRIFSAVLDCALLECKDWLHESLVLESVRGIHSIEAIKSQSLKNAMWKCEKSENHSLCRLFAFTDSFFDLFWSQSETSRAVNHITYDFQIVVKIVKLITQSMEVIEEEIALQEKCKEQDERIEFLSFDSHILLAESAYSLWYDFLHLFDRIEEAQVPASKRHSFVILFAQIRHNASGRRNVELELQKAIPLARSKIKPIKFRF